MEEYLSDIEAEYYWNSTITENPLDLTLRVLYDSFGEEHLAAEEEHDD